MRNRRGKMLTVVIGDDRGNELDVTFFSAYGHEGKLQPGVRGFFVGHDRRLRPRLQLTHPEYELFDDEAEGEAAVEWYRTHRVPVYSTTGKLNSLQLRALVHTALDSVDRIREPVPDEVRAARGLVDRAAALRARAPAGRRRPAGARARPPQVRRGVRPPDDPRPAPQGGRGRARDARPAAARAGCSRPSTRGCPSSSPRASARSVRC